MLRFASCNSYRYLRTFMTGRDGGEQASYNGYTYSHGYDNVKNGNRYWACKDKKKYKPACKGRMTTTSWGYVSKVLPHSHSSSSSDIGVQQFLSSLRTTGTKGKPSTVVRKLLLETPDYVKCHLSVRRNLLKRVTEKRRRDRGHPTCTATCAREYVILLPTVD